MCALHLVGGFTIPFVVHSFVIVLFFALYGLDFTFVSIIVRCSSWILSAIQASPDILSPSPRNIYQLKIQVWFHERSG